jgi:ADP-ribosylglycohydrolase
MTAPVVVVGDVHLSPEHPAVADRFEAWLASRPGDVGIQTSRMLYAAGLAQGSPGERLRRASRALHEETGRSAGNGALMRTSVVGLTRLHDRVSTAAAARAVAVLTHWDPLAGDACVLWSEAIRVAVLEGRFDLLGGLDLIPAERRSQWAEWIQEAVDDPRPERFGPNGFTVTALQAAVAALVASGVASGRAEAVAQALHLAVSAGHDTDTVAAITGGLAGAVLGVSAVPHAWRRQVHGWPGPRAEDGTHLRARDLIALSLATAVGGERPGT